MNYKIEKVLEIRAKLQGAYWAREKSEEYHHYGQCENIQKQIGQWLKDLKELKLSEEEREEMYSCDLDYELAKQWCDRLR